MASTDIPIGIVGFSKIPEIIPDLSTENCIRFICYYPILLQCGAIKLGFTQNISLGMITYHCQPHFQKLLCYSYQ